MKKFFLLTIIFCSLIDLFADNKLLYSKILFHIEKTRNVNSIRTIVEKFQNSKSYEEAYTYLTNKDVAFLNFIKMKDSDEIKYICKKIYLKDFSFIKKEDEFFYKNYIIDFFSNLSLQDILKIKKILFLKNTKNDNFEQIFTAHSVYNGTSTESVAIWKDYNHILSLKYRFELSEYKKKGLVNFGTKYCVNKKIPYKADSPMYKNGRPFFGNFNCAKVPWAAYMSILDVDLINTDPGFIKFNLIWPDKLTQSPYLKNAKKWD